MSSEFTISIDPQANGVGTDGNPEGIVYVKPRRDNLVQIPFRPAQFSISDVSGSASNSAQGGNGYNSDQTGGGYTFTVPSGSLASPAGLRAAFRFRGTVLYLRYQLSYAPAYDFSAVIDGVAYHIYANAVYPSTQLTGNQQTEVGALIAENLPPGEHQCDLVFTYGSTSCTYSLYGISVDSQEGYRERPTQLITTTSVLTTSANVITNTNYHGIRKVYYYNYSGGAVNVTLKMGSNILTVINIAASGTQTFDPGALISSDYVNTGSTSLSHLCDTPSGCQATVFAGIL